jgi:hypothetical protein
MTSGDSKRAEELKRVKEEIQLDEQEIQRLDELSEEARIRNKIIRAEIMTAVESQSSETSDLGEEIETRLSGDEGGDDKDKKKDIDFTLEKERIGKGSVSELGRLLGGGSSLSFKPSGDITVRIKENQLYPVLGRVMTHESAATGMGKSGTRMPGPVHETPNLDMYTTIRETLTRRAVDRLRLKGRRMGLKPDEVNQLNWLLEGHDKADFRRWIAPGLAGFNAVRLKGELRSLLDKSRHEELSLEEKERRAWIMQQIGWRLKKNERRELGWNIPEYGERDGALKYVKPYMFITTWDMVDKHHRELAWWWRENLFLRSQHNLVRRWLPKKYKLWWARKAKKSAIETLYEDIDEEIYNQKYLKELGKLQTELEDVEEEITGYDVFTVEEEKKIKKMFQEWVKQQEQWERLQEAY